MKKNTLFIIIICSLLFSNIFAQYPNKMEISSNNFGGDTIAIDQFGKIYTYNDLKRNNPLLKVGATGQEMVVAGMFRLFFQSDINVNGFTERDINGNYTNLALQRRNVLAQVCIDITVLLGGIQQNNNFQIDEDGDGVPDTKFIDISVTARNLNYVQNGQTVIPLGQSNNLLDTRFPSISPTLMQEYIQTGVDPTFSNNNQHYHGIFELNFNYQLNWSLDFRSVPASNSFDLYSVFLHELMHALGFSTNLVEDDFINNLNLRRFTVFDTFLEDERGLPLINLNQNYTLANCNSVINNIVSNNQPLFFNNLNYQTPVFIGNVYSNGTSFAHFGATNQTAYLMDPMFSVETFKRYIHPDEVNALRAIGYNTTNIFGNGSALLNTNSIPGILINSVNSIITYNSLIPVQTLRYVIGIDDNLNNNGEIFSVNAGEPITIPFSDLLSNDFNASTITSIRECINNFHGYFSNPNTANYFSLSSNSFTYTPNIDESSHLRTFTYFPSNANGILGFPVYIQITVNSRSRNS